MGKVWSAELELVGAGGERVDLWRTLSSHGVADLQPNALDEESRTLQTTLPLPRGRARTVRVGAGRPGFARVEGENVGARDAVVLADAVRHMLRFDADLSAFYEVARADAELSWAADGAGRMLRSPTVFEDVVKTICTTNCAWSATVRMAGALVSELGIEAPEGGRTFPTPQAMAEADERFYKDVVRAGYRGPYLRSLATDVAGGTLDLEALNDPELPDEGVAARLLALPGCGALRDGAHDDAPGPLLPPHPRLVDAPEVRAPARAKGVRQDDRAALPRVPRLRGARVLALLDP